MLPLNHFWYSVFVDKVKYFENNPCFLRNRTLKSSIHLTTYPLEVIWMVWFINEVVSRWFRWDLVIAFQEMIQWNTYFEYYIISFQRIFYARHIQSLRIEQLDFTRVHSCLLMFVYVAEFGLGLDFVISWSPHYGRILSVTYIHYWTVLMWSSKSTQ